MYFSLTSIENKEMMKIYDKNVSSYFSMIQIGLQSGSMKLHYKTFIGKILILILIQKNRVMMLLYLTSCINQGGKTDFQIRNQVEIKEITRNHGNQEISLFPLDRRVSTGYSGMDYVELLNDYVIDHRYKYRFIYF